MKKIILLGLAGTFLLLLSGTNANSQLAKSGVNSPRDFTFIEKIGSKNTSHFKVVKVAPGAIRNFHKSYKNVSNEQWFELPNEFVVMFSLDDINYQVAYNKKGNLDYTIRTYSEEKMPKDLRHIVKSTYYDYAINLVQEIERPNESTVYLIQLTDKTALINLKVCDEEVEEVQRFKKSE
ncbi:MAG TPA: hypothetical protein VGG71_15300 [Chitinophagaceae bacterium]|jgi:hypothetical protein